MSATPIRCTAPHPDDPRRPCNARLGDAVAGTVEVLAGVPVAPGCVAVKCPRPRCDAVWVVCALRVA